eukprot:gb/GECG01004872.1/.p1 GENE.gb/GECG01004872.1/~~gb/GECG01004872.1/.p1  ORF type:complete len:378 (+),score=43.14 gb/GECG01004872.1/:1-1134(+)
MRELQGEIALITRGERLATILAREPTTLLELSREHFQSLFVRDGNEREQKPRLSKRLSTISPATNRRVSRAAREARSCSTSSSTKRDSALLTDLDRDTQAFADFEMRLFHSNCQLEHVLRHPRGIKFFRTFLKKEHSEENLKFWEATQDHRLKYLPVLDTLNWGIREVLFEEAEKGSSHEVAAEVAGCLERSLKERGDISASDSFGEALSTSFSDDKRSPKLSLSTEDETVRKSFSDLLCRTNECAGNALSIHRIYVIDSSRQQVNVSSEIKDSLEEAMTFMRHYRRFVTLIGSQQGLESFAAFFTGSVSREKIIRAFLNVARLFVVFSTCFNDAQDEIRNLMSKDTFTRFKTSQLFAELMDEVEPYTSQGAKNTTP